mmetsp:Transcript_32123/g.69414  ORF Transcript_32123/g.69414 Transcript_32123/m.69414 type:complete len:210 (+) Transcript_32123:659-1288(+)
MDLEATPQSVGELTPNAWEKSFIRFIQHPSIPQEGPTLRGGENHDDMIHFPKALRQSGCVATASSPDPLARRNLNIAQVHRSHHEVSALPVHRRRQTRNGRAVGRDRGDRHVWTPTELEARELQVIDPRDQMPVLEQRRQEPIRQHIGHLVFGQALVRASAQGTKLAEAQAVSGAFLPLTGRHMFERAERVQALPKLQEGGTFRHSIRI